MACTRPDPPTVPGDIVLIIVDTLRPDHLGVYDYERPTTPNLERLFAGGQVYERAYASAAYTPPSVVSILSGLYAPAHRVRSYIQLLPEPTRLISERLPASYQTAAFVSSAVLTDEAMGMAGRFDHYDDFVDNAAAPRVGHFERVAGHTTDAALGWLRVEREREKPIFLVVHYIDPHWPYEVPENWSRRFSHADPVIVNPKRLPKRYREKGVNDGLVVVDDYDDEIAYTDAEIGRLLDGYATLAEMDTALIILTADHGETMMEQAFWFSHSYYTYDSIVRVPLILRGPGVPAARNRQLASTIDIAPTILAFAGVPPAPDLPGYDLRNPDAIPVDRTVFSEAIGFSGQHTKAAIQGQRKWVTAVIADAEGATSLKDQRLYDLAEDPGERTPLPWPKDDRVARELVEWSRADPDPAGTPVTPAKGVRLKRPKISPRANAQQLEQLRALGYVE